MKKFARVVIAAAVLVLCFTLSACGNKYASRYSAMLMVRENAPDKASVSFDSFSGTYVIKLKNKSADEAFINYEATLGEGNIKVYYDFNDKSWTYLKLKPTVLLTEKQKLSQAIKQFT